MKKEYKKPHYRRNYRWQKKQKKHQQKKRQQQKRKTKKAPTKKKTAEKKKRKPIKKDLVIVESPAKEKTIERYLGRKYVVRASNGHVRDLPRSQMGVDVENNYEPKYITIRGKGDVL